MHAGREQAAGGALPGFLPLFSVLRPWLGADAVVGLVVGYALCANGDRFDNCGEAPRDFFMRGGLGLHVLSRLVCAYMGIGRACDACGEDYHLRLASVDVAWARGARYGLDGRRIVVACLTGITWTHPRLRECCGCAGARPGSPDEHSSRIDKVLVILDGGDIALIDRSHQFFCFFNRSKLEKLVYEESDFECCLLKPDPRVVCGGRSPDDVLQELRLCSALRLEAERQCRELDERIELLEAQLWADRVPAQTHPTLEDDL